ncbi:uncharacterized protein [Anabrus simplex]|uniref:uncharacterized protein n=1 Tax=Anabrus simplex TaxID=316456 RepID=UPI0035A349B2
MESERTPLRSGAPAPNYVFMTNPNRVYRSKIRQFQCCVCAAILTVFIAAVVITVSYSVNHDTDDDNGTTPAVPSSAEMLILLKQPWPLKDPIWSHPAINTGDLEAAIEIGQEELRSRDELESVSPSLDLNSPSFKHTKAVSTSPRATELARSAFVMNVATKHLMAGRRMTTGGSVGCGPKLDADWVPEEVCRDTLDEFSSCPPTQYRSVDGSCNNLQHPLKWGVAMRPFRRTMPADYADGVSEARTASDGSDLPSAREVSVTVHRPLYHDDPDFTVMLAVWGQFIDHDITATALSQKSSGKSISCCRDGQWPEMKLHPECFPVRLSVGDPFYHTYNLTCMEFVRSAPAATCSLGAREQVNQASNFLDASVIYGSTPELMSSLRRHINGELRMMVTEDGRTLLPQSEDPNDGCNRAEMNAKGRYCFLSGDSRANENTHLTSMHLLWARQHNALAAGLAKLNPAWDDERLFQETRRIVSAQMEHITYNEFLPIIFGKSMMDKLELTPKKAGYYEGYDETVDPTIANSFAASAFRFAHTLLPSLMKILANATNTPEYVEMHKILFNPYVLYQPGYLDGTLKGLMNTDILKVDPHVSSELSQHLFESSPRMGIKATPCGLDLVSLNIQRGRDHGLPSYPNWREHCGLSRPTSFADLTGIMDDDSIARISTIYKSVEDIDMYTGMLSEIPLEGGIIGPTVTCVLADQFVRLKKGDRYWYETSQQPQAFTPEQLDEIRKTTLAKVLCDTSDSVGVLQRLVMRSVTPMNPRVSCSELPTPDLSKWREVEGSYVQASIGRVKIPSSQIHIAPPTSAGRLTAIAGLGTPTLKTLAVGATVMGGRIFTAGGTAWSGQLPLAIPVPLFDVVDYSGAIDTKTVDPPIVGHGILWEGTLSTDSYGYANFEGRFSMPRYIHGKGFEEFSIKWLSGEFSFYTKLTWDSTRNIPITVSGKYSSPVYLQERAQYQYLKDPTNAPASYSFNDVSSGFVPNPTIQNGPGVYRSPCILHGAYSTDRKTFYWTGNITLIIPNAVPYDTWANYWSQTNEMGLFKRSSWLTSSKPGVSAATTKSSVAVGVTVTSGSVTASSNGSSPVTWWNGNFPVAIPVPIFNRVLTSSTGSGSVVFGTGVSWSGSSTATGLLSSSVTGNFSLPIYVHGPGANLSIQWWEGNFSMQTQTLWNTSLNGAFLPGVTYTSPIYLQAPKSYGTLQTVLDTLDDIDDDPTLQLLTPSGGSAGLASKVPIILHGNYTPDKTQFYWTGNITFILPTAPPLSSNTFTIKVGSIYESGVTPTKSLSLGMTVEGGRISTTAGNIWNGEIPVAIPVPLFDSVAIPDPAGLEGTDPPVYGHGIVWTGGISSDSSGYANMEGTFSMPKYVQGSGIADLDIQWLSGDFVFHTHLIWNSTGIVPTSIMGKYSSPVYLRATKQYEYLRDLMPASVPLSNLNAGFMSKTTIVNDPSIKKAPIILHGTYSTDKTMFIWSGNATLVIPNTIPSLSLHLTTSSEKISMMKLPAKKPTFSMAVGASVTSGSITASSGGSSSVTWWNGAFPATLPVPLFNKVISASAGSGAIVFGSGVSWSGSVVPNGAAGSVLSGTFSLPIYTHGPGTNLSIEWWTGTFSLQYNNLWNATLEGAVLPGVTYTSPIFFRQAKSADSLDVMIKDYVDAEKINKELEVNLLTTGAAGTGPKIPIILHGNYTPDKTQFYWFGNVTFILPLMPPSTPIEQELGIVKTASYNLSPTTSSGPPLVLSGIVTSGSVSSGTGSVWSGEVPVAIPLPLFDSVANAGPVDMDQAAPPAFGHGILWDGTVSTDYSGMAKLEGTYSMPKFVHGPGLANFSIEWVNGNFMFSSRLTWNSSLSMPISFTGRYSSPVYLRAIKEFEYLKYTTPSSMSSSFYKASGAFFSSPSVVNDPAVLKAPLILLGAYSVDKTTFIWSGNYSMIIPNAIPALSQSEKLHSSWMTSATVPGVAPKSPKSSMAVGVSVTSGSITASSGGSSPVTWWNGAFPATLPVPLFNKVISASTGSGAIVFGSGVSWSGSVVPNGAAGSVLSGTFSLPIYTHGPGTNLSIDWWTGTFSLQYNNLWNATLEGAVLPGVTYTSPIFFRQAKSADSLDVMIKDYVDAEKINSELEVNLLTSGAAGTGPKMPIILHGNYTPDKTQFYWFGNVTFILPLIPPSTPIEQELRIVKTASYNLSPTTSSGPPLVLGGIVTSGSVSSGTGSVWSGEVPVAIPVPLFDSVANAGPVDMDQAAPPAFGHGILWDGTVSTDYSGMAKLEGTYSMPKFVHGPGLANFSIEWVNGNFMFSSRLTWNSSLSMPISFTGRYSSPVYLRAIKEFEYLKYTTPSSMSSSFYKASGAFFSSPSVVNDPAVLKAPLILLGAYSVDKTTFIWSGNYSIIIPNAIPALSQSEKLHSSWMTSATVPGVVPKSPKSSMAVGVSVTSGSITASSGGSSPVTWWNGAFPATLPVPLFNKVISASTGSGAIVFGSGVSWSGSVVPNGAAGSVLSGTFSLPIYTHGPGTNLSIDWWTGTFSLQYNNLWNATLEGAVLPGVTYTSPIFFRQAKSADSLDVMIKDYVDAEKINSELEVNLLTSGAADTAGPKMPIILHGNYTPDKTQFYWFGNATFILPLMPPSPPVMTSNVRLTSSPVNTFIPTKPIRKPLVLGATVMGGKISTTAGSAWSGQLPVAIPVPLFDSVATLGEIDIETTDPPIYGHGILWEGTVSKDSSGYANFQGKFSMPNYIHGNGIANFTTKWLSGSFVFYTRLVWNYTIDVPISVSGTYSSPVYLQEQPQYEYLKDPAYASMNSFSDVSSGFTSQPSISNGPGVFRSPCILHGIYSDDRKTFLWSGNFTLIVPNAVPIDLWPGTLSLPKLTEKSWLQSQFTSGDLTNKTVTSVPIGLNVTSGKVTASMDDSIPITWWDGSLPAALPVPLFNKVVTASKASGPVIFGTGVSWTVTANTNTAGVSMLNGTFSLPIYVRGPGALFSIQWWNGDFSLQVNTLLNQTLDAVLQPGITYSSPIYLRASPIVNSLATDVSKIDSISSNPTLQFVTSAKGDMSAEPKAPIILYGTYSPDKTQFWWSGLATLMAPPPTPSPLTLLKLQKKMKTSVTSPKSSVSSKITLGAVVTSGSVVANSDSSSPSMWWNGEFPVAIPSNSFDSTNSLMSASSLFAQGVSWQGSLTKTSLNEIVLQGTFSMPRFIHGGGLKNFSIEWYRGQFSFQMSLLWNSTVDGLVLPGDTFSSPIYLQPVGMKNKSEPSFLNWDQPAPQIDSENLVHFISKSQEIISGATLVPVVLEGTYSSDFSNFWWSGNVILSFPVPLNPQSSAELFARIPFQQAPKDGKPGKPTKPAWPVKPTKPAWPGKVSTTIGVSVVSGSIIAGLDGNDSTVWWDGQIPLSIPLPANDSLTMEGTAPALPQNITWTGTLVSDAKGGALWEGQFSLPSFNTSNGIYTNSTTPWTGHFSFKLSFLWPTSADGLVKPGVAYTSHVKLINSAPKKMNTLVTDINDGNDVQPEPSPSPTTERPPEPSPNVGPSTEPPAPKPNTYVPIILKGSLSPDQTTFQWMGTAIISFPIVS